MAKTTVCGLDWHCNSLPSAKNGTIYPPVTTASFVPGSCLNGRLRLLILHVKRSAPSGSPLTDPPPHPAPVASLALPRSIHRRLPSPSPAVRSSQQILHPDR